MIRNIRKIGNSKGIIIPQSFLEELGSPAVVDISLNEGEITMRPYAGRITRGKPRDEDETIGFFNFEN